jgi:single-stranded-DNA-specific exonuclease
VCLGTVTDVVPAIHENRILVKHGLFQLTTTENLGLRALIDSVGLRGKTITAGHVGFILGPRLNAAGRLGSAEISLKLLLSDSPEEVREYTRTLEQNNRCRQKLQEQTFEEALQKVEREVNFRDEKVIVLSHDSWHPGVVGIVASRIVEAFHRPTIMIASGEKLGKGSGRSIKNFHLCEALNRCSHLLEGYGGHKYAVGISILKDNVDPFKDLMNEIASAVLLPDDLIPVLDLDAEVALSDLTDECIAQLEAMAPFGPGNPRPLFVSRSLELRTSPKRVGKGGLKLWITDGKVTYEAIGFKISRFLPLLERKHRIDLAYSPVVNFWQGARTVELRIEDIKVST